MARDKDGGWRGSMGFAQFAGGEEEDSSEEEETAKKQELIGRGMGCAQFAGGAVRSSNKLEVKRGQISRFVRGKDRKESLSRQMRMDQLKDRFQLTGGLKDKPNTYDDEDIYGPKISQKIPTSDGSSIAEKQKTDLTNGNSDSHNVGEIRGKRQCKDVIDDLQSLPCKKMSSVSEGEAGQSIVESECPTTSTTAQKPKALKNPEASKEKNRIIDHQRVEKREKDDLVEEPAHLLWKEGYDRVLPEELLSNCLPDECKVCKVKLPSGGARQHYWGSRHAKAVARALEHIPRGVRPRRVMEGHSITPTLTPKVMEEAEKAWSLKPKEYEEPVDQREKERRARFRVSRGQIHHYNKDSRRLDFWI